MIDSDLQEIYDIRRKHWEEAGGTWEGLCARHERFAKELREKGIDAILRERREAWVREKAADALASYGAMAVCEGEAPGYGAGETSDSARKGNEGE